jgi:hypothetical protein
LASHGGADEERAFHNYWKARGGQAFFDRFTAPIARGTDSYVELRRMVTRRAYLARLSQEWTMHGLDNREAFFWAGPLVGQYVPMTWRAKEDQQALAWRKRQLPPLQCDRPEYVQAMVQHWARLTGELP